MGILGGMGDGNEDGGCGADHAGEAEIMFPDVGNEPIVIFSSSEAEADFMEIASNVAAGQLAGEFGTTGDAVTEVTGVEPLIERDVSMV